MKTLLVCLALCASVLHAEYVQTPFGRVWIGPGAEPKAPVTAPVVAPPAPRAFVPAFEQGVTVNENQNGIIIARKVNEQYYATADTADAMCKRLFCLFVLERDVFTGGPYTVTAPQRFLVWPDGLTENAGVLAAYFVRNPEADFPGLADRFVNGVIATDRAAMQARASVETGFAKARAATLEAKRPPTQ